METYSRSVLLRGNLGSLPSVSSDQQNLATRTKKAMERVAGDEAGEPGEGTAGEAEPPKQTQMEKLRGLKVG